MSLEEAKYGIFSRINYLILLLLAFLSPNICAQQNLDSLRLLWNDTSLSDSIRFSAHEDYGYYRFIDSNADSAFFYAQKSLEFAKKLNNTKLIANAHSNLGLSAYHNSNFEIAMRNFEKSLDIAEKIGFQKRIISVNNNMGIVFLAQSDYDNAIKSFKKSVVQSKKIENYDELLNAYNNLGVVYQNKGENSEAFVLYEKSVKIIDSLNLDYSKAAIYSNLGRIERRKGNYKGAVDYYLLSIKENKLDDNNRAIASNYLNLGTLQNHISDFQSAIEYLNKSLVLFEDLGDKYRVGYVHMKLGLAHLYSDNYKESISNLNTSLKIMEEVDSPRGRAGAMSIIGQYYADINKPDSAKYFLFNSLKIRQDLGEKSDVAIVFNELSDIEFYLGNYESAKSYSLQGLSLAKETESLNTQKISYSDLHGLYSELGMADSAYHYLLMYNLLNDSLTSEENRSEILKSQFESDYMIKQVTDSLEYVKKDEINKVVYQSKLNSERNTKVILLLILLLIAILSALLYYRYKNVKRQKELASQTAQELENINRLRNTFFANISHEFKTPLSVINGMSELIESNPDKWLLKGFKQIRKNTGSLLQLVSQILDLQKLENDELQIHLVQADIKSFIQNKVDSFIPLANKKGLELSLHTDLNELVLDFDPDKINKILNNLIFNAIKFTTEGSIDVNLFAKENDYCIEVKDTGIGINEADIENIFDRFYQADTINTKVGEGTGIGLQYVSEIVKKMTGELKVSSQLNEGSVFSVILPITRNGIKEINSFFESEKLVKSENVLIDSTQNLSSNVERILIVEDNPDIVELLMGILSENYSLSFAENGALGIEKAIENVPDLIVSDVMMPQKDGFELVDELKNHTITSHIPIILLTAKSDYSSRLKGLIRGADSYLSKPFNIQELKLTIENLLRLKSKFIERFSEGSNVEISSDLDLKFEDQFIIKFQECFHQNMSNSDYGILDYCQDLGVGRTQLHNKLKALTGYSTSNYVRNLRLNKAMELILNNKLNISEIAYEVGFSSHQYFTTSFTKFFGKSPLSYQEKGSATQ